MVEYRYSYKCFKNGHNRLSEVMDAHEISMLYASRYVYYKLSQVFLSTARLVKRLKMIFKENWCIETYSIENKTYESSSLTKYSTDKRINKHQEISQIWNNGSVVKSTDNSWQGPRFSSHHGLVAHNPV